MMSDLSTNSFFCSAAVGMTDVDLQKLTFCMAKALPPQYGMQNTEMYKTLLKKDIKCPSGPETSEEPTYPLITIDMKPVDAFIIEKIERKCNLKLLSGGPDTVHCIQVQNL